MEALQVRYEESFPSLLEGMLSQLTHRNIEVINASVSGWGTDDELTYLMRYGLQFEPDLVIVAMTLHNDVLDNLDEEFHSFSDGRLVQKPEEQIPFISYSILSVKGFFASHSHLYQLALRFWRRSEVGLAASVLNSHVAAQMARIPEPLVAKGWMMTKALLDKTQAVTEKSGARFAVILLPLAIQVSGQAWDEFGKSHGLSKEELIVNRPQQIIHEWGVLARVPVIDLLPGLQEWTNRKGNTLFLENDGHWTQDGHRLAADIATKAIRDELVGHSGKLLK
jgi:hypothetical protein